MIFKLGLTQNPCGSNGVTLRRWKNMHIGRLIRAISVKLLKEFSLRLSVIVVHLEPEKLAMLV
jgi:hypothetical protein